jgi:hypothetical protein
MIGMSPQIDVLVHNRGRDDGSVGAALAMRAALSAR